MMIPAILNAGTIGTLCAQKKTITNESYQTWTELKEMGHAKPCMITNDGKYIAYQYQAGNDRILVVQAMKGSYRKETRSSYFAKAAFTEDSKKIIWLQGDSLCILSLGTQQFSVKSSVREFSIPPSVETKYLGYTRSGPQKEFVLLDLVSGGEDTYPDVEEFAFDREGNALLLRTSMSVIWLDVSSRKSRRIASGSVASQLTLDENAAQAAFLVNANKGLEVRYYRPGMDSSIIICDSRRLETLSPNLVVSAEGYPGIAFSKDSRRICFNATVNAKKEEQGFELWSYKDPYLFSNEQLSNRMVNISLDLQSRAMLILNRDNDWVFRRGNRYALTSTHVNHDEIYWNKSAVVTRLVDITTGERRELYTVHGQMSNVAFFSPDEKFVVWVDHANKQYYSYEIATGVKRMISADIPFPLYDNRNETVERERMFGLAGWTNNNQTLLMYDQYDVWQVDVRGRNKPVNMTGGFGRSNNIMLRRPIKYDEQFLPVTDAVILLTGFNTENKQNGFFRLQLRGPQLIAGEQGPYLYCFPAHVPRFIDYLSEDYPEKAKNANIWVVRRSSASESPNLFVTTDFQTFTPLTNIHPEKEYNWLTAELIKWELPNGQTSHGVLYKPENFDASKKYPVIFHYYEKFSDAIHAFPGAEQGELTSGLKPTWGIINIAWYVSNGYLVFVPDIHYERTQVERSVVNSVTSAVKHLSSYPFIDTGKMGLQGHSFGGEETVMLIVNTHLFRAAQQSAGLVNSFSYYNHHLGGSTNRNHYFDREQGNLGATPWERPGIFLENSPLFRVQQIQTPLFIMHNKGDGNVPITQAVDLFVAMRRLQKPVWMIDYGKEESHQIVDPKNQLDFTIKQQQFFGHYLKGQPLPTWMQKN